MLTLKNKISSVWSGKKGEVIGHGGVTIKQQIVGEAMVVGRHIIAELYGVDRSLISEEKKVREILERVTDQVKFSKVGSIYKQFDPYGVTGVILIEESHISIHTWPEYELVNLDIFSCGHIEDVHKAFDLFLKEFKPKSYRHYVLDRG